MNNCDKSLNKQYIFFQYILRWISSDLHISLTGFSHLKNSRRLIHCSWYYRMSKWRVDEYVKSRVHLHTLGRIKKGYNSNEIRRRRHSRERLIASFVSDEFGEREILQVSSGQPFPNARQSHSLNVVFSRVSSNVFYRIITRECGAIHLGTGN